MSREMAYVVTVNKIDPIEGKDRIVYAHFAENGYGVICDKSFSEGDKAVYFEVDSVLPVRPEFEFLRKRCYKENLNGFLIKNMKMNVQKSFPKAFCFYHFFQKSKPNFS